MNKELKAILDFLDINTRYEVYIWVLLFWLDIKGAMSIKFRTVGYEQLERIDLLLELYYNITNPFINKESKAILDFLDINTQYEIYIWVFSCW